MGTNNPYYKTLGAHTKARLDLRGRELHNPRGDQPRVLLEAAYSAAVAAEFALALGLDDVATLADDLEVALIARFEATAPAENNADPVLAAIGNKTVDAGVLLTFVISATNTPSSDTLTYAMSDDDLPIAATFTPSTRTFAWTPTNPGDIDVYSATFTVTDGNTTDSETISITVEAP